MVDRLRNKDDEINKAILEWLISKNYTGAIEAFLTETNIKKEDASKGSALEKRWSTILTLQKKVSDLEAQNKQLKEDLEKSGTGGISNGIMKKENESMVEFYIYNRVYRKHLPNLRLKVTEVQLLV